MRCSPFHHQLSDSALGSSSKTSPAPHLLPPRVRVAGRARTLAGLLPSSLAASLRREGRVCFLWGPAPLARRPYRACALPPGLHLGIGRKRERETGTRPGLWCGEAEPEKRRGGEGTGTALSYNLSAVLWKEKGKGRGPGREWGLSPSDPGVRGAVRSDVLGVGPLSVAEDLGLSPLGPEFPGLTPRFSNIRVSAPEIPDIRDSGPNLSKPGALFHRISNIWGSGPCVHQYPGFIPHKFKYQIRPPLVQIPGVQTPTIRNPEFSNCRPRGGGGLDREVRSGCHPLPSRGGFPGPPLRKGESRGRGGKGKGLLAPLPAWQSRWRTPGGGGGAGAP